MVTGAASGIGKATVAALLEDGYRVFCWDRNTRALAGTVDEFDREHRGAAIPVECDIASAKSVAAATRALNGAPIGVLVNNAAAWAPNGPLAAVSEEAWEDDLRLLLGGPQRVTAQLDSHLESGAAIVTVSSVHGLAGSPHWGTYDVAKAGLINWTRVKAAELGPRGVTANVVAPGVVQLAAHSDPTLEAFHISSGLVPRLGTPDDVARAIAFLADPRNSFITGTVLVVDGGMTARLGLTAQEVHSDLPSVSRGEIR
ncbi:MAG TPA: SDR family oxidoreductase [Pseudolysinimonas sp.]|nr:SDR family oxidoreductase [Pseudolysinimonas sp.]